MFTRSVLAALVGAVLLVGQAAALPSPASTVIWHHPDAAFFTTAASSDVNGDGVPDLITGGGDRNAYVGCLGADDPSVVASQARDIAVPPIPKVSALDGATGYPLWEHRLEDFAGFPSPAPLRETFEVLEQVVAGEDLGGDANEDVLVLNSTYDDDEDSPAVHAMQATGGVSRMAMIDTTTGSPIWEETSPIPNGTVRTRMLRPVELFGQEAAVVTTVDTVLSPYRVTSTTRVIGFTPGQRPQTLLQLSPQPDRLTTPLPYVSGDGRVLVFLFQTVIDSSISSPAPVEITALELDVEDGGALAATELWSKERGSGLAMLDYPAYVTGDLDPKLILAGGTDPARGGLHALSPETGETLWWAPVYAGQGSGSAVVGDVNGDGIDDVVAGEPLPDGPIGPANMALSAGGLTAIDGKDGTSLWTIYDFTGKSHPQAIHLADVAGDSQVEVVASMAARDPAAVCSVPQDEQGMIAVYDGATGADRCHMPTDRVAWRVASGNVDGAPGEEVLVPTLSGNVFAFGAELCVPEVPEPQR